MDRTILIQIFPDFCHTMPFCSIACWALRCRCTWFNTGPTTGTTCSGILAVNTRTAYFSYNFPFLWYCHKSSMSLSLTHSLWVPLIPKRLRLRDRKDRISVSPFCSVTFIISARISKSKYYYPRNKNQAAICLNYFLDNTIVINEVKCVKL